MVASVGSMETDMKKLLLLLALIMPLSSFGYFYVTFPDLTNYVFSNTISPLRIGLNVGDNFSVVTVTGYAYTTNVVVAGAGLADANGTYAISGTGATNYPATSNVWFLAVGGSNTLTFTNVSGKFTAYTNSTITGAWNYTLTNFAPAPTVSSFIVTNAVYVTNFNVLNGTVTASNFVGLLNGTNPASIAQLSTLGANSTNFTLSVGLGATNLTKSITNGTWSGTVTNTFFNTNTATRWTNYMAFTNGLLFNVTH